MYFLLSILLFSASYAGVSSEVLISGKIGNEFDEHQVKVVDSDGQKYFLARRHFPKEVSIKEGDPFSIEIDEGELHHIKLLKK